MHRVHASGTVAQFRTHVWYHHGMTDLGEPEECARARNWWTPSHGTSWGYAIGRCAQPSGHPPVVMFTLSESQTNGPLKTMQRHSAQFMRTTLQTNQLKEIHEAHRHRSVEFHFLGLGGDQSLHKANGPRRDATAQRERRNHYWNHYGNHSLGALKTLNELIASNEGQPSPDVLKIDCEGCEWPALLQMARRTPSVLNHTSVLFLEVHVAASMVPKGTTSEHVSEAFHFLLDVLGFRVWWMRNNPGYPADHKVAEFAREAGVSDGQCCYELALVRLPTPGPRRRAVRASN